MSINGDHDRSKRMIAAMMYRLLADSILVMHTLFIAFVMLGFILILIGMFRQWGWIRNLWFRLIHLLAIGFVVAESWLGEICPLTEWESRLREAAGGVGYAESFIEHWLPIFIFYELPSWVFNVAYTVFAILVLVAWIRVPPRSS